MLGPQLRIPMILISRVFHTIKDKIIVFKKSEKFEYGEEKVSSRNNHLVETLGSAPNTKVYFDIIHSDQNGTRVNTVCITKWNQEI